MGEGSWHASIQTNKEVYIEVMVVCRADHFIRRACCFRQMLAVPDQSEASFLEDFRLYMISSLGLRECVPHEDITHRRARNMEKNTRENFLDTCS